jgi:hypothetical protein
MWFSGVQRVITALRNTGVVAVDEGEWLMRCIGAIHALLFMSGIHTLSEKKTRTSRTSLRLIPVFAALNYGTLLLAYFHRRR